MAELIAALLLSAAVAPDAGSSEPHEAAPDAGQNQALPPEITTEGLQAELRRSAKDHRAQLQKLNDERAQLAAEREDLKKVSSEVEAARRALKQESEALHDRMKKAAPASATAAVTPTPGVPPGKGGIAQLGKTLRGMKPQQAAQVLTHLESTLAVDLLDQMRPADRGEVLDQLKPEQAAQLIAAMASRERRTVTQ